MGSEWSYIPLRECGKWLSGGTPAKSEAAFWNGNIPWISAKSMTTIFLTDSDLRVTETGVRNGTRLVPAGTILILVRGSILHQRIPIGITVRDVTFNQDVKALIPGDRFDDRFLLYWFLSNEKRLLDIVDNTGIGAGRIPTDLLLDMKVPCPELSEQRAIAHILGPLDDKIELNRKMNETLEAMAQALFKSWFVDFDPVIDNALAAGNPIPDELIERAAKREALGDKRKPLSEHIRSLFPDEFQFTDEMGWIPKGWAVKELENVCKRITDGSHSSPKSQGSGFPMASVKDMESWGINTDSCRNISKQDYEKLVANDCKPLEGDVLIAKDGSYLKHIFVVGAEEEVVILSSIAILRPNEKINSHILCFTLKQQSVMNRMRGFVSGAVLQRIVLKDFRKFRILVPPAELQAAWLIFTNDIFLRVWVTIAENQSLAKLRDLLLPRLISGELRLSDISNFAEVDT